MLGTFGLGLLLRDERAVAVGELHLHVGNPRARGGARAILHGKFGDARQLPQAVELALVGDERVLRVHVKAPAQRGGALFEQNPPVTHVAARPAPLHGSLFAVEGKLDAVSPRLPEQPGKQCGVAPLAHDQVRIVGAQEALKAHHGGLFRIVEHAPLAVDRDLQSAVSAVLRIHARQPFQARLHDGERRQLVIDGPLVVETVDGMNLAIRDSEFGVRGRKPFFCEPRIPNPESPLREDGALPYFDVHLGQREDIFFPAVHRRQHQVRVIEVKA